MIVSDKTEAGITATQMGAIEIPMAQIKNTPGALGEADVMKTIQLMPGVQAGVEGSAGLYVRGGGPDQNLILLDGIPIYNVDHLFGFFSVFTPEAVKKVTFFKSSFPARFGGRLSSVVDVRSNDGDMKKFHGTLSVGLLASKLQLEGPIIKDKTSFNLSARRSYIDLVAKPFMPKDDKMSYYFYDINAKVNHKFSDRSRLFLSFYKGKDHYSFKSKSVFSTTTWGNDYDFGNTPFVASGALNNGVMKCCDAKQDEQLDAGNCITVSPVDGSTFYQPMDFLGRGGAGSSILMLRSDWLNLYLGQFIARTVRQTCSKYTYGHMGNKDSIKRERIMLPVDDTGEPDYAYMEQYTKNMMLRKYQQYLEFINRQNVTEVD